MKRGRGRALRSFAACSSLLHSLQILQILQGAAAVCPPADRLPPYLRLRGGGYAYQKPGRRPYIERHTPGQVDARDTQVPAAFFSFDINYYKIVYNKTEKQSSNI